MSWLSKNRAIRDISGWGLASDTSGVLLVGGCDTTLLADTYGTPLHVVNRERLVTTCNDFMSAFKQDYGNEVNTHFAFKCNPVPGIIRIIKDTGMKAEVMSQFELELALSLGYAGEDIVVNGPFKTDGLLHKCLEAEVRFINIDSLNELRRLDSMARGSGKKVNILLRINPGFVPTGMNSGSSTASRKGSLFGLDLQGGEAHQAIDSLKKMDSVGFRGFHFHIGTGIHNPHDYFRALKKLNGLVDYSFKGGFPVEVMDIGGGFGVPTSREMTSWELLLVQAFGKLPDPRLPSHGLSFKDFAGQIKSGIAELFKGHRIPQLILEPGRCIISSNQMLLARVHDVKERKGVRKWIITDAGIGTAAMPVYYEFHELLVCNDIRRKPEEKVTLSGQGCFSADLIYSNKWMPLIRPGEVISIMDSGAYFTSWESNFGFPRPAIAVAYQNQHGLIRQREDFKSMVTQDHY